MPSTVIEFVLILIIVAGLTLLGAAAILLWTKDKTKKLTYLRLLARVTSMIVIFYLLTLNISLLLTLVIIVGSTLFVGRLFCSWVCPLGLYLDLTSMVREALKIRHRRLPQKANKALHYLRYILFASFLLTPFIFAPSYFLTWTAVSFFIGPFKPATVLVAPVESLIVPWRSGPIGFTWGSISFPYLTEIIHYSSGTGYVLQFTLIFIFFMFTSAFFVRRFWCRFCPTGISLSVINKLKTFRKIPLLRLNKVEQKCTKCGICKRVCFSETTAVYEQKGGDISDSMCMVCLRCIEMCPYDGCLNLKLLGKTIFKSGNWVESK